MREQVGQGKKTTTISVPTLKQPTRGFGLDSPETSPAAVPETELLEKPPGHDISKISLRPQAKLSISQPGDFYEQQADSIAQQVMRKIAQPARQYVQPQQMPEEEEKLQMKPLANFVTPLVQRQQAPEEEELQMKAVDNSSASLLQRQQASQEEEELQMKPMVQHRLSGMTATSDLETSIQQSRGSGQPLADDIKQPMEQAFGADFDTVHIHTDAQSDKLNKSIQARAFTTGQDIFFRQGEYSPGSNSGKELLAHELTHVIQQNGGAVQRKSLHLAPKENKLQTKYTADSGQAIQMRESSQKPTEETENKTNAVEVKTDTRSQEQQNQPPTQKQQAVSTPPADGGDTATDPPPTKKRDAVVGSAQNQSATGEQAKGNQENQPESKDDKSATGKQVSPQSQPEPKDTKANSQKINSQAQSQGKPGLPKVKTNQAAGNLPASNVAGKAGAIPETPQGNEAVAGDGEKAPASPEEDPAFQAVVNTTKEVAHQKKKHGPADKKAGEAQAAAEPPSNEVDSKAQANQVGEMEKTQTPAFDAAAFKAKLMQRIADMAPKTLEEADNFKNNNQLDSVKGELSGQVKEGQKATQEPLAEKTKEKPDTSGIEAKQVTPLSKTDPGKPPSGVGANQAAPKSKGQGEVEAPLQADSQKIEQQMSEADVTEEQLAKSNEPEFQGALAAKKDAQTSAVEAPPKYRLQEQAILKTAQATAETTVKQHLDAMHNTRSQNLGQVADHQVGAKGKDEQARAKVAGDINKIYENTKVKVEKSLSELDGQVIQAFDSGAAEAKKAFEDYVGKRMDDYKSDRYSGFWGPGKWLKDKLFGMPSEVNAFYEEGRNLYIKQMDGVINNVVAIISKGLTQAKAEIASGKQEIQNYINKLPQDLKGVGQKAAADIESKFAELEQTVDSKQDELIDTLAQKYKENLDAVDARIEEMKAANQGLVQKALDFIVGVIKTIIELTKMLLQVLARVASVVGQILKDPIGFLGNLIQAVKQGFLNFMKNIGKYLQAGLIGWLTGTMAASGLQIPENLDIKGIFSVAMQLLGFTYEVIRAQAVKRLGEKKVSRMEQSVEVFRVLASQGIAGMWQFVQDRIGDLNTLVIEPIKNFVIEKVITAGIEWILSLLTPASAFIKAAKAIYEIVKFFIERAGQIADLINAILDAIGAIAAGSLDQAIKGVENALAKSLPVVISFLASLLGLGGIAGKIQAIFQKLRKPVEKAVDWIIDKGTKAFKKIGNKFKNSKLGKKAGKLKDSAKEKYKAGKQWVEDKKEAGKNWVNDQKAATFAGEDKRTQEQKSTDLKAALKEAEKIGDNDKLSLKEVNNRIKVIKSNYRMQYLKLVVDKHTNDGDIIHFEGKINPEGQSNQVENKNNEEDEGRFDKLLYESLKQVSNTYYKGYTKVDIRTGKARQLSGLTDPRTTSTTENPTTETSKRNRKLLESSRANQSQETGKSAGVINPRGAAIENPTAETPQRDRELLERSRADREETIKQEGNKIHQELAKAQIAYSVASQAEFYPSNTFKVGAGDFFVCQVNNYYIVPTSKANPIYDYYLKSASGDTYKQTRSLLQKRLKDLQGEKAKAEKAIEVIQQNEKIAAEDKTDKIKDKEKLIERIQQDYTAIESARNPSTMLNICKELIQNKKITGLNLSTKAKVGVPRELTSKYDYGSNPVSVKQAKEFYKNFPSSITGTSNQETVFVASVVAEPSRHSVAHITNMLSLDERSKGFKDENENVFQHLSMSQAESDPNPRDVKPEELDSRLNHEGKRAIVTSRDLSAVKDKNPKLYQDLRKLFADHKSDKDESIVSKFSDAIIKYLDLPNNG
ncbi:DUF4157 domain-containing protein [Nostoc sp. MS1]|uniref:eCIS core domain-containing protein n=1 Tax=Nostoc sp. MS1 TaxID=2764711 RepID=UPI001CC44B67|nr:DUF4157 domain-containing protein [Nostoc sp. MS1]BCL35121.1 hypothetical protein NSMS1_15680 [Nostoc sp. MS1]